MVNAICIINNFNSNIVINNNFIRIIQISLVNNRKICNRVRSNFEATANFTAVVFDETAVPLGREGNFG